MCRHFRIFIGMNGLGDGVGDDIVPEDANCATTESVGRVAGGLRPFQRFPVSSICRGPQSMESTFTVFRESCQESVVEST